MTAYQSIEDQITAHEGIRLKPYRCKAGKLTIGIGRNLGDTELNQDEVALMLHNDIRDAQDDLVNFFGPNFWEAISEGRRRALLDLRFNVGPDGFRKFRRLVRACRCGEWAVAAYELVDSRWWDQVQDARKELLHHQLLTGEENLPQPL